MDIFEEMDIVSHARKIGNQMQKAFSKTADHPAVKEVRHLGAIGVVELKPVENSKARSVAIRNALRDQGILIRPLGDIFYLLPPFIISEQELSELCTAFLDTIKKYAEK